jgi:hypothetical protein
MLALSQVILLDLNYLGYSPCPAPRPKAHLERTVNMALTLFLVKRNNAGDGNAELDAESCARALWPGAALVRRRLHLQRMQSPDRHDAGRGSKGVGRAWRDRSRRGEAEMQVVQEARDDSGAHTVMGERLWLAYTRPAFARSD